jgi:alpha-glucosidase (family GH31 glycosyl hydrolase)
MKTALSIGYAAAIGVVAAASAPVVDVGMTHLHICADDIIRVTKTPTADAPPTKVELIARADWPTVDFSKSETNSTVTVTTKKLKVSVEKATGRVTFRDASGKEVLAESEGGTVFTPTEDMGKATYSVEQSWEAVEDEGLYGGGEFQNGFINYKDAPIQLVQFNTEAVVPFFVSTKGYGLLWDNYAWSYLNKADTALTWTAPASDSDSLADGAAVVVAPCQPAKSVDFHQQWKFDAASSRLFLFNEDSHKKVLDYDHAKGVAHLWHDDPAFPQNQQWNFTRDGSLRQGGDCLAQHQMDGITDPTLTQVACNTADPKQVWHLDSGTGQLSLAAGETAPGIAGRGLMDRDSEGRQRNSNVCLTAGAPAPRYTTTFTADTDGVHHFYVDACPGGFGCGSGKSLQLYLGLEGGKLGAIIDWEQLTNMPNSMTGRATLTRGRTVTLSYAFAGFKTAGPPPVLVRGPALRTTLRSDLGDLVDYFFTFGGAAGSESTSGGTRVDRAIAGYRAITGAAPLYSKKAYGFWQCKEHYQYQKDLLAAAHGFRNRSIPIDNIVQDWHYWGTLGWGPQWDPAYYPDPAAMVQELKGIDVDLMVSVWSKFDTKTKFFKNMTVQGQMINGTSYYDAWNPAAREQFYQFSKDAHFSIGVQALWLDATEPEHFPNVDHAVYGGSGNAFMNSYSLMTTKAIADGLRRDYTKQQGARVFSLTRSAFAGQQATGAALWSGDISGKWDSMRRQVAASINYQMSGMPYWSQDIGGFFRPHDQYTSPDYQNLLVRWFQFGCFTPLYRVHGGGTNTEIWNFGDDVTRRVNMTHALRYRMLPYNYAGFHRVEAEGWTMQRGLPLAFPDDAGARGVGDQFMWGECLLVAPVTTAAENSASARAVYLPRVPMSGDSPWVDFWTGGPAGAGGDTLAAATAPIERAAGPLFARPGSLLALGPELQFVDEKAPVDIELRVYPGGDASFALFEDDGSSQDYQSDAAARSLIAVSWTEATRTVTFAARDGGWTGKGGALAKRRFAVVVVSPGHGAGAAREPQPDATVEYDGAAVSVHIA